MKVKSEKVIFLILSIINVLIFTIVLKDYYGLIDFSYKDILVNIFIVLVFFFGIYIFKDGKKNKYKILGAALTIIASYFIYINIKGYNLDSIISNINLINLEISSGNKLYYEMFKDLFTIISLFLTMVSLLTFYIFPFNLIIIDFTLLLFLEIVEYNNLSNSSSYIYYFTYIIILSIILYRNKSYLIDKKKKYDFNIESSVQVIILSIIILLSFSFINLNKDGIYIGTIRTYLDNELVGNKYISGYDVKDHFTLKETGYSDGEKKLGGDIDIDNSISLRVDSASPLYLRGSVKYKYKGDSWEKYDLEVEDKQNKNSQTPFNLAEATIIPEYKFTSALFNTINTKDVILLDSNERILKDKSADLYFLKEKSDTPYKILYKPDDFKSTSGSNIYRKKTINQDEYITKKVSDLAKNLVDTNMSSEEAAIIITNYLKNNYSYSLKPGNLNPGKDFVEEFLFENQKGYCVHFATSLTVLLNSLGIEARYVEGFKMSDEIIDGRYIVRNSDAHAWSEVLIDEENNTWAIFDSTGTIRDFNEQNEITETEEDQDENKEEELQTNPDENIENEDFIKEDEKDNIKESKKEKSLFLAFKKSLDRKVDYKDYSLIALIIIIIFLVLNFIQRRMRLNLLLKSSNFDLKFLIYFNMLEDIYGKKNPNRTFKDYKNIIKNKDIEKFYEDMVNDYYIKNYSQNKIKDKTYKRDKTLYLLLLEEYKNKKNIFIYFYNKYIKVYGFTKYI